MRCSNSEHGIARSRAWRGTQLASHFQSPEADLASLQSEHAEFKPRLDILPQTLDNFSRKLLRCELMLSPTQCGAGWLRPRGPEGTAAGAHAFLATLWHLWGPGKESREKNATPGCRPDLRSHPPNLADRSSCHAASRCASNVGGVGLEVGLRSFNLDATCIQTLSFELSKVSVCRTQYGVCSIISIWSV